MIVCHLCPQGRNLVSVGDPPYGDARRLRDLLRNTPGLQVQTQHLSPQAQAAEVEAWDRGLPSVVAQVSASGALAEAQRTERGLKPDPLHEALATILEERVSAGEPITAVITRPRPALEAEAARVHMACRPGDPSARGVEPGPVQDTARGSGCELPSPPRWLMSTGERADAVEDLGRTALATRRVWRNNGGGGG